MISGEGKMNGRSVVVSGKWLCAVSKRGVGCNAIMCCLRVWKVDTDHTEDMQWDKR